MNSVTGAVKTSGFGGAETAISNVGTNADEETERLARGLRQPIRVLLVEDDDIGREYFCSIADQSEFFDLDITHCGCREAACNLIAENDYAVVFVDFWLGNETGLTLIDEIAEAGPSQPIVILSNLGHDDISQIANRSGATAFLSKTDITPGGLDTTLSRLLSAGADRTDIDDLISATVSSDLADDLKSMILALDAVHAHAAIANGSLASGRVDDAATFLEHTIESASSVRRSLFDLVCELRREGADAALHDEFDATDLVSRATGLVAYDAQSRDIQLDFSAQSASACNTCDPLTFLHMVESLMAAVIWKACAGTKITIDIDDATDLVVELTYVPDRVVRLDAAGIDDSALHTVLSDLHRQASKYGGSVTVFPSGQNVVAALRLPEQNARKASVG